MSCLFPTYFFFNELVRLDSYYDAFEKRCSFNNCAFYVPKSCSALDLRAPPSKLVRALSDAYYEDLKILSFILDAEAELFKFSSSSFNIDIC